MKGGRENQVKRSKTMILNRKIVEDQKNFEKEVNKRIGDYVPSKGLEKRGYGSFVDVEVKTNRKSERTLTNKEEKIPGRKELEVTMIGRIKSGAVEVGRLDQTGDTWKSVKKSRQHERDGILERLKQKASDMGNLSQKKGVPVTEWKEQIARVGTGYRVRKDEKDPRKRRFDVGYADLKSYKRKDGREATVDGSNMGRTIQGKGRDARVKVINAVSAMEKRRPVSEYTGSGILRKSRVGKLKLKPTKPSGKE